RTSVMTVRANSGGTLPRPGPAASASLGEGVRCAITLTSKKPRGPGHVARGPDCGRCNWTRLLHVYRFRQGLGAGLHAVVVDPTRQSAAVPARLVRPGDLPRVHKRSHPPAGDVVHRQRHVTLAR